MLDTSVAIALGEVTHSTLEKFNQLDTVPMLSTLSLVELYGGLAPLVVGVEERRLLVDRLQASLALIDFRSEHAAAYRSIIEQHGFSRPKIIDRMIAAQAIVAGAMLATLNPRDFRGIAGLQIEDWSKPL